MLRAGEMVSDGRGTKGRREERGQRQAGADPGALHRAGEAVLAAPGGGEGWVRAACQRCGFPALHPGEQQPLPEDPCVGGGCCTRGKKRKRHPLSPQAILARPCWPSFLPPSPLFAAPFLKMSDFIRPRKLWPLTPPSRTRLVADNSISAAGCAGDARSHRGGEMCGPVLLCISVGAPSGDPLAPYGCPDPHPWGCCGLGEA